MMPRLYWQPWLGDHVGVSLGDLGDLRPVDLMRALEYVSREP